jgi:hypothetical protein
MKVGTKELVKVIEYFKEKAPHPVPCAVCNQEDWVISGTIYELREYQGGQLATGGGVFPVLPIVCGNCGNTIFMSAIELNIIEREAIESKENKLTEQEEGVKNERS